MTEDHSVDDTLKRANHCVLELLLDALGLSQVNSLDEQDIRHGPSIDELSNLGVQIVPIADEQNKLAQVALEKLTGDS